MGYHGVIATDCLEMEAIASPEQGGCGVEEGAVRSLEAGTDIHMICHTMKRQVGAIEAVWAAVQNGRLKIADIREAEDRVARMKDHIVGRWNEVIRDDEERFQEEWTMLKGSNAVLSRDAYRRSTTLVWENGDVLPLIRDVANTSSVIPGVCPRHQRTGTISETCCVFTNGRWNRCQGSAEFRGHGDYTRVA